MASPCVPLKCSVQLWSLSSECTSLNYFVDRIQTICLNCRVDLPLESRLEHLTLAVGNAKSRPISVSGRHESANLVSARTRLAGIVAAVVAVYGSFQSLEDEQSSGLRDTMAGRD
jgi:hypothetical protein